MFHNIPCFPYGVFLLYYLGLRRIMFSTIQWVIIKIKMKYNITVYVYNVLLNCGYLHFIVNSFSSVFDEWPNQRFCVLFSCLFVILLCLLLLATVDVAVYVSSLLLWLKIFCLVTRFLLRSNFRLLP